MKRRSVIKIENFLLTNAATLGVFALSFICSWAIPVHSFVDARKATKENPRRFGAVYSNSYNARVSELAEKPLRTYVKCRERGKQRLKEFDKKQR